MINNNLNKSNLFVATIKEEYIRDAQIIPYREISDKQLNEYDENSEVHDHIFYNHNWYDIEVNHFVGIVNADNEEEALKRIVSIFAYPANMIKISKVDLT